MAHRRHPYSMALRHRDALYFAVFCREIGYLKAMARVLKSAQIASKFAGFHF